MESTLSVTEAVKKFVAKVEEKYKGRRLIHEEQLLHCKSEKLVRLELVERERLQVREQRGSGDKKVVRTPLAYTDFFKVENGKKEVRKILVEGDAGIGKTTFCITISEKWANGEILQDFELLLLLPLREQEVASAGSLIDLLKFLHPSEKKCNLVKEYFEEDEGKILVIADGWDELSKVKREEGSFLYRFLFGSQYCSVYTLVTSRPSASAPLHHHKCIDQFAEIRGFDKEHMVEYINSEFDQKEATELIEKLESNPVVESICSIPINCVIICHLWREHKGDLPTTMTGIYTQIIFNIILRNIRKVFPAYENMLSLSSFDELPESLQLSWWLLCEFAFQTLKKDQLVFSDKDLKNFFPQGISLSDNILCFGLLQSSVSSLEVGCGRSFNFLHLTFQEYLAALYLVKQESDPQVADCSSLFSRLTTLFPAEGPHSIILRFFFGIVFNFEAFRSIMGQRILTLFPSELCSCYTYRVLSHFLWAFEAQNDEFVHTITKCYKRFYSKLNPSTVHEVVAVVYVIALTAELEYSGRSIVIDFHSCGLRDNHIMALTDALASKDGKLQVKGLNLYGNKLTDKGVTDLFHRASTAFQSFEYLDLGWNWIGGEGISSALATLAKSSFEVKFYFYDNPLEASSLLVFRDALCHHQPSSLTELHLEGSLSNNADTNADFILALDHCHCLRILDLSRNILHAPGGGALGRVLPQLSLDKLKVNEAMLGDEGIAALAHSLDDTCYIGTLDLVNNDIHATGVLYLAKCIDAGKIVIEDVLCLDDNSLCWEGAIDLIKLLIFANFQICCLSLQRCKLTTVEDSNVHTCSLSPNYKCITYSGIREFICSLINKANSVEELYLNDSFTGEAIQLLAGFMCLCPHLKVLDCSDCQITSDDLKRLLSLLSQLRLNYLETWDLSQNNIDDDGVSALIEQLPKFPPFTCIIVDNNDHISPKVLTNLKEILEKRRKENFQSKMEQRRQIRHMCDDQAMMMNSSILAHKVSNHCSLSTSDSMELTRSEAHLQNHQEAQLIVVKGKASHGQSEGSRDSDDDLTSPSSPAPKRIKLQKDESELKGRATEERPQTKNGDSSLETEVTEPCRLNTVEGTTLECKTLSGEEMQQLHPIVAQRTIGTGSQLGDVLLALEEITRPQQLGIYLGIEAYKLEKIEKNFPRDIERQMTEVIKYWMRNQSSDSLWEALANAVEKMGGHRNLVKRLRDKHLEMLNTTR